MKRYLFLICLLLMTSHQIWSQWTHVGPTKSSISGQYENGRIDLIVPHPSYNGTNNQRIYAGSTTGGLWYTINDGNSWINISTTSMYYSGVSGFDIDITGTYLYVADINSLNYHIRQSSGIYRYTINSGVWLPMGSFPQSSLQISGLKLKINHVKIHPGNSQIIFACTNVGIYRTTNGGNTWSIVDASAAYENVVFLPIAGGGFEVYASGMNKFKFSMDNGNSFQDVFSSNPFSAYDNFYADLGYAYDNSNNRHIIYLFGRADKSTNFPIDYPASNEMKCYSLYKFHQDANGNGISQILNYKDTDPSDDRLLVYGNKDVVYIGGDGLRKFNFITNQFYMAGINGADSYIPLGTGPGYGGAIHPDLHDLKIIESGVIHRLMAATDGGFYVNDFTSNSNSVYTNNWSEKNNGMDISQIWGFSSSQTEPDFYSTGEADTKGYTFNSSNMSTCISSFTEPISTLIDGFDANNIFFNSYQGVADAQISLNHGSWYSKYSSYNSVLPGNVFIPDDTNPMISQGLSVNHFYQDLSRPNKIYMGGSGLWQYNPQKYSFGCKFRTGWCFGSNTLSPLQMDSWGTGIIGIAISPVNENKFYMIGKNNYSPSSSTNTAAQVYNFTGGQNGTININDSWIGHNECAWNLITPDLKSLVSSTLSNNDIFQVNFPTIAVSDWDPDKIWIGLSPVPNFPNVKILKRENGVWTDYSTGISKDEEVISLVYERGSNDGIYLGTNKNIYYTNASKSGWSVYSSNDLPKLFMVQLNINYKENTLRAGTYGRGIWKSNLHCPISVFVKNNCTNCNSLSDFFWEGTHLSISNTRLGSYKLIGRGVDFVEITPGTGIQDFSLFDPQGNVNTYYEFHIHGCGPGQGNSF